MNSDSLFLNEISSYLSKYEWFYKVGLDEFKRPVVYVHFMNYEIINLINTTYGFNAPLIHFAGSLHNKVLLEDKCDIKSSEDNDLENSEDSYYLYDEVSSLKDICGGNILSDIFYEIHDGKNAITNLSNKFPDIRKSMENLYDKFGFDIIYDLLS